MPHKVEQPYSDIDRMLAEHDELHGDRNDKLLTGHPSDNDYREVQAKDYAPGGRFAPPPAKDPEYPYGREPRKDWPRFARWWTPELIVERQFWVRKYIEAGLNFTEAAARIGVHPSTIRADVHRLDISQGPVRFAADNARVLRRDARREEVRLLFEQGLGGQAIADQLGAHSTTVQKDLREMGLTRSESRVANVQVVAMTTKALVAMDDMAQLLLNLPELEVLQIEEEQAQAWLKQLRRIARATGRVRKTTKGTQP